MGVQLPWNNSHYQSSSATSVSLGYCGGGGAVLTAAALLLTIYCTLRGSTGGGATAETQTVCPDPNIETYTALNMSTMSPDYDTLAKVMHSPGTDGQKKAEASSK
ncbi:hypothetical protein UPYG_G00061630 [Umbra pygmaea]|uniref:Uncharacterized protein n=1 Tax=Umbra pygmaea TaxID=75934 RepID=A0ABD0X9H9_UMBPY